MVRFELIDNALREAGTVKMDWALAPDGKIEFHLGVAQVDMNLALAEKACERKEFPAGVCFAVNMEAQPNVPVVTSILSAAGLDDNMDAAGLEWGMWSDAIKEGYSAKKLKALTESGEVRTKEEAEAEGAPVKTLYCLSDLRAAKKAEAK